ncbi:MAG: hypothetical protein NTY01_24110, partial [Verrucomicrobia bacterium]|nr:hypothetical protein [Verrucomicrobiota bacterium]
NVKRIEGITVDSDPCHHFAARVSRIQASGLFAGLRSPCRLVLSAPVRQTEHPSSARFRQGTLVATRIKRRQGCHYIVCGVFEPSASNGAFGTVDVLTA